MNFARQIVQYGTICIEGHFLVALLTKYLLQFISPNRRTTFHLKNTKTP